MQPFPSISLPLPTPGSVLHIPAGTDFSVRLVDYIETQWERTVWPEAIIFLPNRRSVQQVRDVFLTRIGKGSALLPSMVPLADIDPEALLLLQGIRPGMPPKPVMHSAQRRLLLCKQIEAFFHAQGQECSIRYALDMADSLAQLFDEAALYGIDMRALRYLVPAEFSAYWERSLAFLSIVFEHWPRIEESAGMVSYHRALVEALDTVSASWERSPPAFPVMVAGSTASQPSTARLLRAVAHAPRGVVMLPSAGVDEAYRAAIAAGHPLYHTASFSQSLEQGMPVWGGDDTTTNARYAVQAFRPIEAGQGEAFALPETLIPISCGDEWEEARVISLIVREQLQEDMQRIMVVSPDRAILRRVGIALLRWGIIADSSSASRLSEHPFIGWIHALLAMLEARAGAYETLAFFQHPLSFSSDDALHAHVVHNVDMQYARGMARKRGAQVLMQVLRPHVPEGFLSALQGLSRLSEKGGSLSAWVQALLACATACAADAAFDDTLGALFDSLVSQSEREDIDAEELWLLIEHVADVPWFSGRGAKAHPRVFLHTPIEARLQPAECVILAGLNEDVWPRLSISPWLNQAMRAKVGLPTYAHELSLQVHDFLMLASHPLVFLTRSERTQHAVTSPSRWWQRLLLVQAQPELSSFHRRSAARYLAWARHMDIPEHYIPAEAPKPNPAAHLRPRSLRATQMRDLITNPYAVYARSILGLEPLDEIDREPDGMVLGDLMHRLLEKLGAQDTVSDADIEALVDGVLGQYGQSGRGQVLWRARLIRGAHFFLVEHLKRRGLLTDTGSEVPMEFSLPVGGEHILFRGRADRTEHYRDGHRSIVDFKTGDSGLSEKRVLEGEEPQLSLYHMAEVQARTGEAFEEELGNVSLAYWVMPHGADAGSVIETPLLGAEEVQRILARFTQVAGHYLTTENPMLYAPSMKAGRYDYSTLARAAEWGGPDSAED